MTIFLRALVLTVALGLSALPASARQGGDLGLGVQIGEPSAAIAGKLWLGNTNAIDMAFGFSALVGAHSEQHQRAVEHAHKALRLSPLDDPLSYHPYCALALTHLFAGAFADAARYAALAVRANPGFSIPYAYLAASHVGLGNVEAAHSAARRLIEVAPNFSVGGYVRTNLFRPYLMDELATALRTAGLPE